MKNYLLLSLLTLTFSRGILANELVESSGCTYTLIRGDFSDKLGETHTIWTNSYLIPLPVDTVNTDTNAKDFQIISKVMKEKGYTDVKRLTSDSENKTISSDFVLKFVQLEGYCMDGCSPSRVGFSFEKVYPQGHFRLDEANDSQTPYVLMGETRTLRRMKKMIKKIPSCNEAKAMIQQLPENQQLIDPNSSVTID